MRYIVNERDHERDLKIHFQKGITKKFNQIARDGSIKLEDGIHLVRAMGENPSKKEYKATCEELKWNNKEKLDLKGLFDVEIYFYIHLVLLKK